MHIVLQELLNDIKKKYPVIAEYLSESCFQIEFRHNYHVFLFLRLENDEYYIEVNCRFREVEFPLSDPKCFDKVMAEIDEKWMININAPDL